MAAGFSDFCCWVCVESIFRPLLYEELAELQIYGGSGRRATPSAPRSAAQRPRKEHALPPFVPPAGRGRGHRSAMSLPCACVEGGFSYSRGMEIRRRTTLPHEIPWWVDPQTEIYFITINCKERCTNQLALQPVAEVLFETVRHRQKGLLWWPHVLLLMPDHLHALLSFPHPNRPIKSIISKWKKWTAKEFGILWQRDFFEHRLREEESRREKADYILQNPVRRKLVSRWEDWPFVYFAEGTHPSFDW
jgi:putative transposase